MINNILVTGGCGFIGANLLSGLREHGVNSIRVFDNESSGKRQWIDEFDIEFVNGDIRDKDAIEAALQGIDCVVHLAADTRVMDSIENPAFNWDVNVRGTFNILEAMRLRGVTRFINASTGGAIIGEATPPVNEEMLPRPTSPYGAAKLAVEGYCSAYAATYGIQATSLRFSNVYGPRSFHKGSVVALFFRQIRRNETLIIYGDGSQTRDYVYVEDLVDGIIRALSSDISGVYQLGTGIGTSLNELINHMQEIVAPAYEVNVAYKEFRDGEIVHTWCDITRAQDTFGYNPTKDLRTGLENTWRWFEAQN